MHRRSGDESSPHRNVRLGGSTYQMYISVKAGTRVPSGRKRKALQPDSQDIGSGFVQIWRDIAVERAVAVWPEADLMAIDINPRLAHRAVEQKFRLHPLGDIELSPVPAHAHVRQAAGTPSLERCLRLHILHYLHILKVIFNAERPGNGPVMRHAHALPPRIIITRHESPVSFSAMEPPTVLQASLHSGRTRLCTANRH